MRLRGKKRSPEFKARMSMLAQEREAKRRQSKEVSP